MKRLPDAGYAGPMDKFTQVPNDLINSPDVSMNAKMVLAILLSNKEGWTSHKTQLLDRIQESESVLKRALSELEKLGYLWRIKYKNQKGQFDGSFWAYTINPHEFYIADTIDFLTGNGFTVEINSGYNKPGAGKPGGGFRPPNNTNSKKTKGNNTKNSVSDKLELKLKDNINGNKFIRYSKRLRNIVQDNFDKKIPSSVIIKWADQIRLLHDADGVSTKRIKKALDWYADNAGGEYVNIIQSGVSLREKFTNLEINSTRSFSKSESRKAGRGAKMDNHTFSKGKLLQN